MASADSYLNSQMHRIPSQPHPFWGAEAPSTNPPAAPPHMGVPPPPTPPPPTSKPPESAPPPAGAPAPVKWDLDEKEAIKRRIYELKRTFHNGRYLIVRHLPRDATEQTVRALLQGVLVHSVQLSPAPSAPSAPSSLTAHVLLAEPEAIETWTGRNAPTRGTRSPLIPHTVTLKGHQVSITPSSTDNLLCVTCLPSDTTDSDLAALVSPPGPPMYCFLMRSETTGASKGYGLVLYQTREVAVQARAMLDQRAYRDCVLGCDWLEQNLVTFASLHSCCILADNLPADYRELGEFRKLFSRVASPPYCQIAMPSGEDNQWGLIEYSHWEEAEATVGSLQGYPIHGRPVRLRYLPPGKRAINLYNKILGERKALVASNAALLPEPPVNKVFSQLQNLTKSNPAFAESLRNIILSQIQNLKESTNLPPTPTSNPPPPPPPPAATIPPPTHLPPPPPPTVLHHIPPPPPTIFPMMHLPPPPPTGGIIRFPHIPPPPPSGVNGFHHIPPTTLPPPQPPQPKPLDSNIRALLAVLMSALTTPSGGGSDTLSNLLSNPQVLSSITNIISTNASSNPTTSNSTTATTTTKSTQEGNANSESQNSSNSKTDSDTNSEPKSTQQQTIAPVLSGLLDSVGVANSTSAPNSNTSSVGETTESNSVRMDALLSDTAGLQRLLGVLDAPSGGTTAPTASHPSLPSVPTQNGIPNGLQNSLSSFPVSYRPPPASVAVTFPGTSLSSVASGLGAAGFAPMGGIVQPHMSPAVDLFGLSSHHSLLPQLYSPQPPVYPPNSTTMSMLLNAAGASKQHQDQLLLPPAGHPQLASLVQQPAGISSLDHPYLIQSSAGHLPAASFAAAGNLTPAVSLAQSNALAAAGDTLAAGHRFLAPSVYQLTPGRTAGSPSDSLTTPVSGESNPWAGYSTPLKRKSSGGGGGRMLPSPEPSPENGYVGQHSQGIGGHYQSSYVSRKRTRRN